MAESRYLVCFFLLLTVAVGAFGKHVPNARDKEEADAIAASPKEDQRTGIDKLWIGRFKLVKTDPAFIKLLEAGGYTKDTINTFNAEEEMYVSVTKKDDFYTMWTNIAGAQKRGTYQLGKQYSSKLVDGREYTGVIKATSDHEFEKIVSLGPGKMSIIGILDDKGWTVKYNMMGIESQQRFEKMKQ